MLILEENFKWHLHLNSNIKFENTDNFLKIKYFSVFTDFFILKIIFFHPFSFFEKKLHLYTIFFSLCVICSGVLKEVMALVSANQLGLLPLAAVSWCTALWIPHAGREKKSKDTFSPLTGY